jgi:hypothetical protein
MISIEQKKILEQLGSSMYGKVLREYLEEKIKELNDVRTVNSWEETLGRKYSVNLIKDLFGIIEERKETTKQNNPYE